MSIETGSKTMLQSIKEYIDKKISSINFEPGKNDNDFYYHTWGEQAENEIVIYAKGNTADTLVAQYLNTMGGTEIKGEYNEATEHTEYHCILPYEDAEMTENIDVGSIKLREIDSESQVYAVSLRRANVRQTDRLAPDYIVNSIVDGQSKIDWLENKIQEIQMEIEQMKGGN